MSQEQDLLNTARAAIALAKRFGAQDAAASAARSREVEAAWRDGKVEKISEATTRNVSLSLFVDGRWGSMSTSDLRPEALERFARDAIGIVRSLARVSSRTRGLSSSTATSDPAAPGNTGGRRSRSAPPTSRESRA